VSGIVLLVILLPLSIAISWTNRLNADISETAEVTCRAYLGLLNCESPALSGQPAPKDPDELGGNYQEHKLIYADYSIYTDLQNLNRLALSPIDHLTDAWKCGSKKDSNLGICENGDQSKNFPQTFEGLLFFARVLKYKSDRLYGLIGITMLPLLAMLGACVFGLRQASDDKAKTSGSMTLSSPTVRLPLAALAGFLVGLLSNLTESLSLPPFAIAFLVGYSSDVFFSFLDGLIEGAKRPVKATPN